MMRKKNNRLGKVLHCSLVWILCALAFVILLFINSAAWMSQNFNGMSFRAAIFQLNTPMKGTGHELVEAYIKDALLRSIIEFFAGILLTLIAIKILSYETFVWNIRIINSNKSLRLQYKRSILSEIVSWICLLAILFFGFSRNAALIGFQDYIRGIKNSNTYLENNFVDPRDVRISYPEHKRNLIFIYLESMESTYASIEVGGGKPENYIPNLTKLAQDNICFSNSEYRFGGYNWYELSGWTMAAIIASSSGTPYLIPVIEDNEMNYSALLPNLYTIGDVLKDAGYNNFFMCGSDARFGARSAYYSSHGDYTIYDYYTAIDDGIIPEDYYVFWGMEDQKLYDYAKAKLTDIADSDEPFNFTILTVDTHHTDGYICDLCKHNHESQYGNVIECADRQIEEFVEWLQEQEWYKDTTVIIVGDHNSMNNNFWDDLPEGYERSIYNCFINVADGVHSDNTTGREMTSMDLFPTTLAALGFEIEGERLGLGTNMFSNVPTLQERDGKEEFDRQSTQYSEFFERKYIRGEAR